MESLNPENSSMLELDDSGCVQDASGIEHGSRSYTHLLDLCDDVLLCILKFLSPRDLKAVGHTCPRLGTLICDRTLWTRVDARTSPVGERRLKWFLTHCLSSTTAELKIAGYANKFSRCLGIQDLNWPAPQTAHAPDIIRGTCVGSQEGVDVEHFLLRMWYPHLPRYAVAPRWPDKAEVEIKRAKAEAFLAAGRASQASADAAYQQDVEFYQMLKRNAEKAGQSCSAQMPGKSDQNSSNSAENPGKSDQNPSNAAENPGKSDQKTDKSDQNSSDSAEKPGNSDQKPGKSDQNSSNSAETSGKSDQKPGKSDQNPSFSDEKLFISEQKPRISGQTTSNSNQNQEDTETRMEEDLDFPYLFGHDYPDDCKGPQFTLNTNLMKQLRKTCSNLTSLALEYCNLDYKTTNLRHFPLHLKKLSLRGSRCYNLPLNTSYLGKVQERLPELEYLDVSECDWFEPASLMPLSKLPNLTELYMRDCKRLTECVAYASLATRYGFRKLRVFDVRGSPLADSEVSALGWLPCLEELYVAPPEDFSAVTEHTHSWSHTKNEFIELDTWEIEEPEYYKIKTPEPEEEEDDNDEEPENERGGDNLLNNPWWSHERRIIVIQPNANRQLEERFPFIGGIDNLAAQNIPAPPRAPRPGERGPEGILPVARRGPANYPVSRRIGPIRCGSIDILPAIGNPRPTQREHVLEEPRPGPADPRPGPVAPRPLPSDPREDPQGSNPKKPRPGTSNSQQGPSNSGHSSTQQWLGPSNLRQGPSDPRQGPSNLRQGPSDPRQGPSNLRQGPSDPRQGPSNLRQGPSDPRQDPWNLRQGPWNLRQGPWNLRQGPLDPRQGPSDPRQVPSNLRQGPSNLRQGPSNLRQGPSDPRQGPSNPRQGPSDPQQGPSDPRQGPSDPRQGPSDPRQGPSNPRQEPSNPQPGPANAGEGTKRRISLREAIDMAKRRRVEINEDEDMENLPVLFPPFNPDVCPRLRLDDVEPQNNQPRPGRLRFRRQDHRPIVQIDVDMNRQSTIHIGSHVGYNLVSDTALLRFGRAINENVNYVHIGRHGIHTGTDSGSRPDRSNLRILSVTGYRSITDRSLEHLVTAAPHLLHIDFTETNVTPRGVELFKAVRPDCDVIFSGFGRLT